MVIWTMCGRFSSITKCPGSYVCCLKYGMFTKDLTHLPAFMLRRPDYSHLEQHVASMHCRSHWPFPLYHVRPIPSQRRSDRFVLDGSNRSCMGYLRSTRRLSKSRRPRRLKRPRTRIFRNLRHLFHREACPRGPRSRGQLGHVPSHSSPHHLGW